MTTLKQQIVDILTPRMKEGYGHHYIEETADIIINAVKEQIEEILNK